MLNEIVVHIYNVFKIGRGSLMQGEKPNSSMILNRYDQLLSMTPI